jgi:peptidoglycan/LPS O-acetylase OafA/YrhL
VGDASGRPDARGHLPALDGLRGIAILLVLIHHATLPSARLSHPIADELLHLGFAGVDLFFVLSGFLITGILLDARGGAGYYRSFYGRRLLRIAPAYYLFLAVTYLVLPLVTGDPSFAPPPEYRADGGIHAVYGSNLLFAVSGDVRWRPVCHLWSLAIEEQFYLLWPLLVAALSPRALARLCAAMIAAAFGVRLALTLAESPHWTVYALTPARWDGLAMGGLLALGWRGLAGTALVARHRLLVALGLAGLYGVFLFDGGLMKERDAFATMGYTSLALLFAGLLVAALRASPDSRLYRVLTWRWLRAIGAVSYAMYLWQMLTRYAFRVFVMDWLEPRAGFWLTQAASVTFVLATTFALAWLSWRLVEARFLRLKRHFPY